MARAEGWMVELLDERVDHVRGAAGPVILEYGDYECPYSQRAFAAIQQVEQELGGGVRFAYRHFPLMDVHEHAVAAAAAAEAAGAQGQFWAMHDRLFEHQRALAEDDLLRYAQELGLALDRFEQDCASPETAARIRRDFDGAVASGLVQGTPTIFIDGRLHEADYDAPTLLRALGR